MRMLLLPLCILAAACAPAAAPRGGTDTERELWIPVQGGNLYVREAGRGPVVVLLHAGGMDLSMWDAQAPELARRFRTIRIDARGHGRSTAPAPQGPPPDDLAAVLDHLGVRRASLVGLSMGAGTAFGFTLQHPERVERLVLASTSGPPPGVPRIPGVFAPVDPEGRAALAATRVPVLVVTGENDSARVRETADALVREVPGARRVDIPGAGHLPPRDAPAAFNRALTDFLGAP